MNSTLLDPEAIRQPPSAAGLRAAHDSTTFVWTPLSGYEPMEECHTADGVKVGWINPDALTKMTPRHKWGTRQDWPGAWEGVPHINDAEGQPLDWELSAVCANYEAAKAHVEGKWSNDGTQRPGSPDGSIATETRKPGSLK